MYGRSCLRLLAALLLLTCLVSAQSPDSGRFGPHVLIDSAPAAPISRNPISPLPQPRPPLPEPLPWHPPIAPALSGFTQLVHAAGFIFSGTVTSVSHGSENIAGQSVGSVAITFRVQTAFRGVSAGESLTITQWIGLWSGGQRFRIGERVLLFLYPPSRLGLTSSVGAATGRFAVDAAGNVWLSPQQISAFRSDPVLGGKSRVRLSDFASAVRWASEEE